MSRKYTNALPEIWATWLTSLGMVDSDGRTQVRTTETAKFAAALASIIDSTPSGGIQSVLRDILEEFAERLTKKTDLDLPEAVLKTPELLHIVSVLAKRFAAIDPASIAIFAEISQTMVAAADVIREVSPDAHTPVPIATRTAPTAPNHQDPTVSPDLLALLSHLSQRVERMDRSRVATGADSEADESVSLLRRVARHIDAKTAITDSENDESCGASTKRRTVLASRLVPRARHHLYAHKAAAFEPQSFGLHLQQEEGRLLAGARVSVEDRDALDALALNARRAHIAAAEALSSDAPPRHLRRVLLTFQSAIDAWLVDCSAAAIGDDADAHRLRRVIMRTLRETRAKERTKDDFLCDVDRALRDATTESKALFRGGRGGRSGHGSQRTTAASRGAGTPAPATAGATAGAASAQHAPSRRN